MRPFQPLIPIASISPPATEALPGLDPTHHFSSPIEQTSRAHTSIGSELTPRSEVAEIEEFNASESSPLLDDLETNANDDSIMRDIMTWSALTSACGPSPTNLLLDDLNPKSGIQNQMISRPPTGPHSSFSSRFPDLYMNSLKDTQTSLFLARVHNAISLNISFSDVYSIKPASPFYRPSSPGDDPKALLALVSKESYPAHLQPTLPQVLFPHHAWIDLLPFPVLRAKAILFRDLYDQIELKRDIMSDGLVPRRSGECGWQPWEMQCWKVAPWFLKKWRMFLVSDEGVMPA